MANFCLVRHRVQTLLHHLKADTGFASQDTLGLEFNRIGRKPTIAFASFALLPQNTRPDFCGPR